MSKNTERRQRQRLKKRTMERIERHKKTIFGNTDLTPYNVGAQKYCIQMKKPWLSRAAEKW